ncbi:MAG: NADH:quinone oxidoreductase, partial [Amylibacter sp.]
KAEPIKPAAKKTAAKSATTSKTKTAVAKKPAAKKSAAPKAKPAPKKTVTKKPVVTKYYKKAPANVDDLKLISGVGSKLEATLNEIGIYQFAQVAVWKKADIKEVDDQLKFKGRIVRDDWMSQAKTLAKGGDTDFSKKNRKT